MTPARKALTPELSARHAASSARASRGLHAAGCHDDQAAALDSRSGGGGGTASSRHFGLVPSVVASQCRWQWMPLRPCPTQRHSRELTCHFTGSVEVGEPYYRKYCAPSQTWLHPALHLSLNDVHRTGTLWGGRRGAEVTFTARDCYSTVVQVLMGGQKGCWAGKLSRQPMPEFS